MTTTEDAELLRLIQHGEAEGLVVLYDRYSCVIYSIAFRILKSPAGGEDVLQELFLQLWRSPERVTAPHKSLCAFMIMAARNRSISMLRRKQPEPLDVVLTLASPLRDEVEAERRLPCERLVSFIPAELQSLLTMAFYEDMSYQEIATSTGRRANASVVVGEACPHLRAWRRSHFPKRY